MHSTARSQPDRNFSIIKTSAFSFPYSLLSLTWSPTSATHALTADGDPNVTTSADMASLSMCGGTEDTPDVLYVFIRSTLNPLAVKASCRSDKAWIGEVPQQNHLDG